MKFEVWGEWRVQKNTRGKHKYDEMEHNRPLFEIWAYRIFFNVGQRRTGHYTTGSVIGRKRENVVSDTTNFPATKGTSCIIHNFKKHSGGQDSVISMTTRNVLGSLGFEPQWGGGGGAARFLHPSGPAPRPIQLPAKRIQRFFPGDKAARAWPWPTFHNYHPSLLAWHVTLLVRR